jgi:hypothetical protein
MKVIAFDPYKPEKKVMLGHVEQREDGYHFVPKDAGRKASNRGRPTPKEAIPLWVKQYAEKRDWTVAIEESDNRNSK